MAAMKRVSSCPGIVSQKDHFPLADVDDIPCKSLQPLCSSTRHSTDSATAAVDPYRRRRARRFRSGRRVDQ